MAVNFTLSWDTMSDMGWCCNAMSLYLYSYRCTIEAPAWSQVSKRIRYCYCTLCKVVSGAPWVYGCNIMHTRYNHNNASGAAAGPQGHSDASPCRLRYPVS